MSRPDRVVETALRLLPIPEHGDEFWTELEATLSDTPSPSVAAPIAALVAPPTPARGQPAVVPLVELQPVTAVVPLAMRRRSNVVLSAVAVAAAVMVVLAGTTLVRQRSDDPAELAEASDDVDGSSTTLASLVAPSDGGPATEAVVSWIHALADGDVDAAWDALGPASKHHWDTKASFEEQRTGFAEGYGAWASATPDTILVTSLVSSGDGEILVVTLIGTVQQEGSAQQRADAFPVRVVDGAATIELFADAGELEIVVPEPISEGGSKSVVGTDEELVVVVPSDVGAPLIRLDDGETLVCGEAPGTELTPLEGSTGQRCGYSPEGGMPAGDRVLTVAFLSPDGTSMSAESVLFTAA